MDLPLHPTLDDILDDFINDELVHLVRKAMKMETALQLHQARMRDVCHSIKAHDHWVCYGEHFPEFNQLCWYCGEDISPEFDMERHLGVCDLRDTRPDLYPRESWV